MRKEKMLSRYLYLNLVYPAAGVVGLFSPNWAVQTIKIDIFIFREPQQAEASRVHQPHFEQH